MIAPKNVMKMPKKDLPKKQMITPKKQMSRPKKKNRRPSHLLPHKSRPRHFWPSTLSLLSQRNGLGKGWGLGHLQAYF